MSALGMLRGLPAGVRVLRADNGTEASVEELASSAGHVLVWTLDQRLRLVAKPLTSAFRRGRSETFEVRFASGRVVAASAETQFLALDGWRSLDELHAGDRLSAPRRTPAPLQVRPMVDDEVVLLAHMIGDGSCIKRQPIRYASIDEQNLMAVTNAAKHFGVTAVRDEYPAARVTTLREQ